MAELDSQIIYSLYKETVSVKFELEIFTAKFCNFLTRINHCSVKASDLNLAFFEVKFLTSRPCLSP